MLTSERAAIATLSRKVFWTNLFSKAKPDVLIEDKNR